MLETTNLHNCMIVSTLRISFSLVALFVVSPKDLMSIEMYFLLINLEVRMSMEIELGRKKQKFEIP